MVAVNGTLGVQFVQDRYHLLTLGKGAHCNHITTIVLIFKLQCNAMDAQVQTALSLDWYKRLQFRSDRKRYSHMEGANASPENKTKGLRSSKVLKAVLMRAAPP